MKILFTCLGNICRSPMAEVILRYKIEQKGLNWEVASNGTNRYHKGGPPDARTIKVCKQYGLDIRSHIATRFKTEDFYLYDLIICMADDVYQELQEFVKHSEQLNKVVVKSFNDPWYGNDMDFDLCFHEISQYCDELIMAHS